MILSKAVAQPFAANLLEGDELGTLTRLLRLAGGRYYQRLEQADSPEAVAEVLVDMSQVTGKYMKPANRIAERLRSISAAGDRAPHSG